MVATDPGPLISQKMNDRWSSLSCSKLFFTYRPVSITKLHQCIITEIPVIGKEIIPVNTFILCVGMRVLMGLCCGLIFSGLKRFDKPGTWSYILSAMSAPFLNTVFFMGWIVLAFYGCDYVQNLVSVKGAANPFMFVVLLVGVQGVAEFLVSGILGGIVARAVAKFVK